ncbi:CDP-abequose synthase [Ephemeroptericola cinctiostellae]|uniref:CDP-abequose synthase n=2 Tax=Ephemeroptericola cinctiostellae TaxID=2268024 RepID=A0A345DC29_9BURK|nr:CDP-abequose synthase [Ephemeroptericola cinctiostellae]
MLLTGATGYIGSQLAHTLVNLGHEVHIVCRPTAHFNLLENIIDRLSVHITNGSFDSINHIIAQAKPSLVIHVASLFISEHQPTQVQDLIRSNVEFPSVLLEAMSQNGVKHLINTSTSWQHYDSNKPDYSPTNLYAATKQAFEDILQYYVDAKKFSAISLTIFDTFGANDSRKKLFSLFASATNSQKPIQMSAGEQWIDLVYIDDVMNAYLEAINLVTSNDDNINHNKHLKFNIKSNLPHTLKHIAETYEKLSGKALAIDWGARPYRTREVFTPWQESQALPNWSAKVSLEDGIRLILQHNASKHHS